MASLVPEADSPSKYNINHPTLIKMFIVSQFAARILVFICLLVSVQAAYAGEKITLAAAADLKFALDEIVVLLNINKHAAANPLGQAFASFMTGREARAVMSRYGFVLPDEVK